MDKLERYGFVVDENKSRFDIKFDNAFNGKNLSKIHIDLYTDKPYMLLSRVREKNISVSLENGRIILKCNDDTVIMNVPIENVCKYAMKKSKKYYQFILAIHGIWYKILVVM